VAKIVQIERKADTAFSACIASPWPVCARIAIAGGALRSGLAPRPPEAATPQKAERGAVGGGTRRRRAEGRQGRRRQARGQEIRGAAQ
jgi:rod shape-determining protein MreC